MGVACALGIGLVSSVAEATFSGAPLIAWAGYYNQGPGLVLGLPGCRNHVEHMPTSRKFECGQPVVTKTATGRYSVKVWNAMPFPTIANDSGYQVFVQTIGGKAHCFEESTTWEVQPPYELTSKVRCVAPSSNSGTNTDVDAQFAWSYRADSGDYPQSQPYNSNHAYARITGATGATVPDQTFDAAHFDGAGIVGARTATGRYRVTFKKLNVIDTRIIDGYLNNVIVQKTCSADSNASCRRSVCIPYSWVPAGIGDSTVDVRCYGPDGNPRDTDFRVFIGDETHNSQVMGDWDSSDENFGFGARFAWVNSPNATANVCLEGEDITFRSQHETPWNDFPSLWLNVCKTTTGRYTVNFDPANKPYHADDLIPVVSGRATGGGYCNVERVECDAGNCGGSGEPYMEVRCYTRSGSALNAAFNASMFY